VKDSEERHWQRLMRALRRTGAPVVPIRQWIPPKLPKRRGPRRIGRDVARWQPTLADALAPRGGAVRWSGSCRRCGVAWRGVVRDAGHPSAVLATLAVLRVPCPVCWALAWPALDQATRAGWSAVPSWLTPRWR